MAARQSKIASTDQFNFPEGLDIVPLHVQRRQAGSTANSEPVLHLPNDVPEADQQREWIERYGIAGRIWEAAPYLATYLTSTPSSRYTFSTPCSLFDRNKDEPPVILELGSGNGFLAIEHLVHQLPQGSTVYLTDLESVVPLLEDNIAAPRSRGRLPSSVDVSAHPLQWGAHEHVLPFLHSSQPIGDGSMAIAPQSQPIKAHKPISHILCSDLVYFPHLLEPLLRSLIWLTAEDAYPVQANGDDRRIEVIIGYKMRSLTKEAPFWDTLGVYFDLEAVSRSLANGTDSPNTMYPLGGRDNEDEDRLFIFLAKRKRTATDGERTRTLPEDLMQQKDGQFEELLMLQSMADNAFS